MTEEKKPEEQKEQEEKKEVQEPAPVKEPEAEDTGLEEQAVEVKDDLAQRETAVNPQAIEATESKKEEPIEEKKLPSFFIDDSVRHKVEVDILFDKETGKINSISKAGLGVDFGELKYHGHTQEWFEFSIPTYDDIATYRQKSSVFNRLANAMVLDGTQMRNFLLVWHLKDWSLRNGKEEKVELKHDKNGSLAEDSLNMVYKVFPTLIDVVLTIFEREVVLA